MSPLFAGILPSQVGFGFVVGFFLEENNSNPSLTALPCIPKDFRSTYNNA